MDFRETFRTYMATNGIVYDGEIIADSKLHRFHVEDDKPNSKNGWFILHNSFIPGGAFGSWKIGISYTWCIKPKNQMSPKEWGEHRFQIENARYQHDKAQLEQRQLAAKRAQYIWSNATPADPHHLYLKRKLISRFIARQKQSSLILPIIDFDYQIWSLQFIYSDGSKKLLSGGAKKGNFIPINNISNPSQLLICEGFATGATLAEEYPSSSVIAAIDAGNLESVAIAARNHWRTLKIIICADDDRNTTNNPGITKGRRAAVASGALFATPKWPKGSPLSLSDFNDLACWLNNGERVIA
jgi:putative DNA primase/helicase